MIKVFIVEDSPVARQLLSHILGSEPEIQVIGTANNGAEALEVLSHKEPDVIIMDINMPKMNGFEATRRIMETHPVPVIIVSATWDAKEVETTFRAVEAGAVAVLEKPRGISHPSHKSMAEELVQTVKLMSEVKVVRRWARHRKTEAVTTAPRKAEFQSTPKDIKVVAIGASTGGPQVLQTILRRLPEDFSAPVLIVQHIAAGFLEGLAEWLSQTTPLSIHIAKHGEYILPGHAYLAPDDFHLGVERIKSPNPLWERGYIGRIALSKDEPENSLRPAVSSLFRSVAKAFGENSVGVLLTGMGRDGAEELKLMREKGAVTIAQDKESSVVHGMPGEAIKLGAATHVLPPDEIAAMLENLVNRKKV
ncbi:MAG: chemotaxis response regulator protein-glutamate methylesterase [Candidatus Poribacteria bacterium]